MARITRLAAMGLLLLMATWGTALAATPNLLQYQGRLTDNAGTPLNGAFTVTFTIYADSLGTTNLWTETRSVTCANGLFSITLGNGTAIGATVFNATTRFMGIRVAPDAADMLPRQRIASSGFAHRAAEADHATSADQVAMAPVVVSKTSVFHGYAAGVSAVVDSIDITIPGPGFIHVGAVGTVFGNHTTGVAGTCHFRVDEARFNTTAAPGYYRVQIPAELPSTSGLHLSWGLSCARVAQKASAGTYRFYLNAATSGDTFQVYEAEFTAMYFPVGAVSLPSEASSHVPEEPGGSKGDSGLRQRP